MMLRKNFALFLTLLLIVSSAPQTVRSYNELNQSFALQPPRSFATVTNSGQVLGTIAVGNVDNDPALEIVVNSSAGINVYDHDGSAVSSFSTQASGETRAVNIAPTLADVDGDGRAEIIFATDHMLIGDPSVSNAVFAINGEDGSVLWEMPITRDTYRTPDSGYQTIAGEFYYDGATHDTLPAQTTFTANASAIPVYDLDGDGQLEAVVTLKIRPEPVQDYNPYINDIWGSGEFGTMGESWSGGNLIVNATSGTRDYIYHVHQLCEAGVALGEVDAAQGTAVFVLADTDSILGYHKTAPHGFYGSGNLIGQFGKNARLQSGSYKKPLTLNAADLTGDGKAEVLYEGHNIADLLWQGSRVIFDDQGRILWRQWYDFPETTDTTNHWFSAAQMIPLNLDGGNPEVVAWHQTNTLFYEEWDGVELVSKGGHWPVSFGSEFPSPPAVGDVDGDGQEEFVVARYNPNDLSAGGGLTILAQDGSVEETVSTARGIKNVPNLYDVDQDGDLDVIVRDLGGAVLIYDTESGDPARVSWATEYRTAARTGALGMRLYDERAPIVGEVVAGYGRVELNWDSTVSAGLEEFRVYRKQYGDATFALIATLQPNARRFAEGGLENGALYIYKIAAGYGSSAYDSAPIPATPLLENNLVQNTGMELNGDNGWDKWYTGELDWSAMVKTTDQAHQGDSSMRIHLANNGSNSSIKQWNQYGVPDAQIPVTPGELYSFGAFVKTDLNQSSRHFIEWGSDYDRVRHDPDGDPIPLREYPFYFSTHVSTPAGASDWWYTNRVLTVQPGITGVQPRHRFYIDGGQASGDVYLDDVFFRAVGAESAGAVTLLPFESNWRYFDGAPPANWHAADFDDGAWPVGQAKFGNGSGPQAINTELPRYRDQYYFRTTFELQGMLSEWVLAAYGTSGPRLTEDSEPGIKEIFINGSYIPIQDPGLSADPGNTVNRLDLSPFIPLLVQGENTIAVKLLNRYASDWDDIAFDVQLKGVPQITPALEASKSVAPSLTRTGAIVTYTIALDNPGSLLAGVRVTDTLPATLVYRGDLWASSGTTHEAGGVITWNGDVPQAGSVRITFSARVALTATATLPIVNTALVDDGSGNVKACQATLIANGYGIYLPVVLR